MIWAYIVLIVVLVTAGLLAVFLRPKQATLVQVVTVETQDLDYQYQTQPGEQVQSTIYWSGSGEKWPNKDNPPVKGFKFNTWTTSGTLGLTTKAIDDIIYTTCSGLSGRRLVAWQSTNANAKTLDQRWTEIPIFDNDFILNHTVRYNDDDLLEFAILTNTNLGWYIWDGQNVVSSANYVASYLGVVGVGDYVVAWDTSNAFVYYQQTLTSTIPFTNLSLVSINTNVSNGTTVLCLHDANESFRFIELSNGQESISSSLTLNQVTDQTSAIAINAAGPQSYSLVYQQGTQIWRVRGTNLSFGEPVLITETAVRGGLSLANRTLTSGSNVIIFINGQVQMSYSLLQADPLAVNPGQDNPVISFRAFIDAEDHVHHHSINITDDGPRHYHYSTPPNAAYNLITVVNDIYEK